MERSYPSFEFEAEIGSHGTIEIPGLILHSLPKKGRVTVKITEGTVSPSLRRRNITEEHVESIAMMQLETRDQVLRFLGAEGSLAAAGKNRSSSKARKGAAG